MQQGLGLAWVLGALAWLLGLACQLTQARLWTAPWNALLCGGAALVLAGLAFALWRGHALTRRHLALMVVACAALGFGQAAWRAEARIDQRLDTALENVDLWVTGTVSSLPQVGAAGTRFSFDVEAATRDGQAVALPAQLALGWYAPRLDDPAAAARQGALKAGQRWQLPLRLRAPHGLLNPHGYDYELRLFEAGIGATGTVRDTPRSGAPRWLADGAAHPVERLRQQVRDAIYRQVSERATAGILAALVIGDQGAIEREDWDLFRRTGVAHLMSISGLHVTMFAWMAGLLVMALWRRSARAVHGLPAQQAGRWGGLLLAIGYCMLAGWGVPAQRTVLMLATVVLLRATASQWPWGHVLLAAAVAVTAWDPWALLQPGFWLSFAAVGLLMASSPGTAHDPQLVGWRAKLRGQIGGHLRSQAIASIGLAPLSLVCFAQMSVVGLGANLLAIPFVTLLLAPLALAGMLFAPLWTIAAGLAQAMTAALAWCASWPGGVWTAAAAPTWALLAGLLGAALGVMPLPWKLRLLAVPLVLPLMLPAVSRPAQGEMEIVAADIGQGTAVLVRTRRHLLVYDSGPQYTLESDAGQRVLLPLLQARGESAIELLMLSHRDLDHVGGAATLMSSFAVRRISSSLDEQHPLRARPVPHHTCAAGQAWVWDGVSFELLHPQPDTALVGVKPNSLSCVLKVTDAQGRSLLLTGDIEAAQESALMQRYGAALRSDILLVPHHGSRTSSTAAFLDAVRPRIAVVQAAYRSRYGHPAPDVMQRYAERDIAVQRSDRCGAWNWSQGAHECTREARRRYWHWSAPQLGAALASEEPSAELPP